MLKKNKMLAQSTLEYLIITAVVIAAFVIGSQIIGDAVNDVMIGASTRIRASVDGIE